MTQAFRMLISGLASVPLVFLSVGAAAAGDDVLWPQNPIRIDRSKQHYERLPPLRQAIDKRIWVLVPQRITVIDGGGFSFEGKSFRIGLIHPISVKRICNNRDGTRWTCGRMAAILLSNLVRGKRLLCDIAPGPKATTLNDCQSGAKNIAAEIISNGLARTDAAGLLQTAQDLARKKRTGLWRNPDCAIDFDHC